MYDQYYDVVFITSNTGISNSMLAHAHFSLLIFKHGFSQIRFFEF